MIICKLSLSPKQARIAAGESVGNAGNYNLGVKLVVCACIAEAARDSTDRSAKLIFSVAPPSRVERIFHRLVVLLSLFQDTRSRTRLLQYCSPSSSRRHDACVPTHFGDDKRWCLDRETESGSCIAGITLLASCKWIYSLKHQSSRQKEGHAL